MVERHELLLHSLTIFTTFLHVTTASSSSLAESHPCQRQCKDGEPARICDYEFQLELYLTMSKACFDCPFNRSDCASPQCIAGDGMQRPVVVINRQMPGPSIQVCEGDSLIVTLKNKLNTESTTIHWHGFHQKNTQFMDGVPMVTQCPIAPYTTFRYIFDAVNPGTHFWHSHAGLQSADGSYGTLIVRQTPGREPHFNLYDYDLPEHVVIITDWQHVPGVQAFAAHHFSNGDNKAPSYLINGKGRFRKFNNGTREFYTPLEVLNVEKGKRYRFRVIVNGVVNCPIVLSIDDHPLKVIASDGSPNEPVEVESLVIYSGERFDFVLDARREVDNYWLKVHGLLDCGEKFTKAFQLGIIRYKGARETEPSGKIDYESTARHGKQLNTLNHASTNVTLNIADLKSLTLEEWPQDREPDVQFYLAFDFNAINNARYQHPGYYPIDDPRLAANLRFLTPQINFISFTKPTSPPLSQNVKMNSCNETSLKLNCTEEYCECVYILEIPLNSLVELVLIDKGYVFNANHPFHLHGSSFRVVAMDRVGEQVSLERVKELDKKGEIKRKLEFAPAKDSITVADGGYTIVRFLATNPGYWMLHCHISYHMEDGMALIFKVGTRDDIPAVPEDFPKCGDWIPKIGIEQSKSSTNKLISNIKIIIITIIISSRLLV